MCGPTLWCGEVNDVAVALEHVDLLDGLDGLDVQLLKRGLELLVVGASGPVDLLDLPAGCALSTIAQLASHSDPMSPKVSDVVFVMSVWRFRGLR